MAAYNKSLGKFHLEGIPPAPRGIPQIEVSFDIDANGILHVKAVDKATSKEQSIRIEASSGLSDSEIEQMVKDAEQHADDDKKRREIVDTKNQADQLIYQTEKSLKENEDKITGDDKSSIESAVEKLKESAKGENVEEIKAAMEGVNNAWAPVASKLYADASAQAQPEAGPEATGGEAEAGEKGEEKVEDADFEVIDDQEK